MSLYPALVIRGVKPDHKKDIAKENWCNTRFLQLVELKANAITKSFSQAKQGPQERWDVLNPPMYYNEWSWRSFFLNFLLFYHFFCVLLQFLPKYTIWKYNKKSTVLFRIFLKLVICSSIMKWRMWWVALRGFFFQAGSQKTPIVLCCCLSSFCLLHSRVVQLCSQVYDMKTALKGGSYK